LRNLLGLALVLDGYQRGEAANLCGEDRQILRDWVIRYNAEGVAGLSDRVSPDPKPRLSPEQEAIVAELVRTGPDPATDGVVRWRRVDLARVIKSRFNVTLAERSVGAMLRRLGFRRLSVRPRHPKQDREAQEVHKKLCRSRHRCDPRTCARKADRTLVVR
jgi:transposase